jgi:RNA polymerase sigma-70 factor (ECF subfamily)
MAIPLKARALYDRTYVNTSATGKNGTPADVSDAVLVNQAQAGDMHAFEQLVWRYRNQVFAVAFRFVHGREDAWDVSQEVFVKAYRALKTFRGEASFKTWLLRITANQCKDYLKKRRLATVAFDEAYGVEQVASGGLAPFEEAQAAELRDALNEALQRLPLKHRTAFILREYEGLSYEEMAQSMGCSLGTVMSRLHHARKKMRVALELMGIMEEG